MPAGAISLVEAAKSGSDQLKAGVVETIVQESPVLEQLPFITIAGTAFKQTVEETLPDVNFRNVNEGYSASWGSDSERFWGVAILGGEVKVDPFLVDVIASEEDLQAKQWAKMAKSNAMRFDYEFFNGNGTNKGFFGVKHLIDEGLGQKLANASGGGTISLDKLDEAHDLFRNQGSADAILLNRTVRRQITKAARSSISGISLIDVGSDVFGRQVVKWNDIPMRIIGDVRNGSGQIVPGLDFNEDPGDSVADCCSLYLIKFGEDDVCGLMGKGGSMTVKNFGETEAAPQLLGRFEWYPGVAVFNKYSVVRLYGITAS